MSKTLLIDANSIGYACHSSTKLTAGGMQTQAVFGFVRTMRELRREYPKHTPMVLWDGRAEWRFKLHPLYKSNRDNDPKKVAMKEAYAEQRPYIARALKHLGIRQVTALQHEADDMAGYFVAELTKNPENEVVLITGDEDWIQLVRRNVTWRDMRNDDKKVSLANLFDKTGYKTPYAFLEGKCLQGDTSDVISGVGKIGEKGAPEFLAQFGTVREFWRRVDSGEFTLKYVAHKNLASPEGRAIFARNLKLMQLLKVQKPAKEDMRVEIGKVDDEAFQALCEELAFSSILKNVPLFTSIFK
ncbi:5'-3' exonuclease [Ralstonia pickettii]|uniref:5'-3' exonuclease family protein n=1 Tax=Ralstonia pickettii TaxID=329 RepID=UPI0027147869|nr:5'-3' exonuclease H3TH domain-containing protein [Ralstonia pickettii]WKZ86254.1 5'-3' exonuclease [Ralstonia pickettii]